MNFRALGLTLVSAFTGVACSGPGGNGDAAHNDASADGAPTCSLTPVLSLFATRCTSSGCHGPGGQYPELTAAALPMWINEQSRVMPSLRLVTPHDPNASWIHRKVSGSQGANGGALMPLGAGMPISEAAAIDAWIMDGAPTTCPDDAGTVVPTQLRPDPNALDQNALFTCSAPTAPRSSPARIRRIDNHEWAHSISTPDAPTWYGSTTYLNPFTNETGAPYSTYSAGLTVDTATLDLYFLNLADAPGAWSEADPGGLRIYPSYNDSMLRCIHEDAHPDAACIDYFVDRFLTVGVLSRAPTTDERARFRTYLVDALAREPNGGDVAVRKATLDEAGSAAWLSSGALFRTEIGTEVTGDPAGRRRLTNDELALSLGAMLSSHRPGSGIGNFPGIDAPSPDDATPERGWLQQIRAAADDGTIQDPAVRRRLVAAYIGGVDVARRDISQEDGDLVRAARGEYWLAPRVAGFFREWLAYGDANSAFKDTPSATSRFPSDGSIWDLTTAGYENLQDRYYGYESTLVQQLDDTIARTVLESVSSHTDVFRALMTTRRWHLPSDLTDTSMQECTDDAQCTAAGEDRCTVIGLCGGSTSGTTAAVDRVYNVSRIPTTQAGRWVDMSPTERNGVLTHPAWLTAHGDNFEDDASLVHRGRWIRERLFCQSVPGLELVMVQARLGARSPMLSARNRVVTATTTGPDAATCTGCHRLMNTLGFPFEIYNHAGFVRESDHGHAPDGSAMITNLPDPALNRAMANAIEFADSVAASPYARRCFIRQAFRYFAGRDETLADACTLAEMESALNSGGFVEMLGALVSSDTFSYRTVDAVNGGAR